MPSLMHAFAGVGKSSLLLRFSDDSFGELPTRTFLLDWLSDPSAEFIFTTSLLCACRFTHSV